MSPVFAKLEQQNFQSFHLKRGGTIRIEYAEMLQNVNDTQILHVVLIALFPQEGYQKWHVAMSMVIQPRLNFIQ